MNEIGRVRPAENRPDARGHYDPFEGQSVPDVLIPVLHELEGAYRGTQVDVAVGGPAKEIAEHA